LIGNALNPLYSDIVDRLEDCAIEVSQSGKGLHIWGQCKNILKHTTHSTIKINHKPVELYSDKRFIFLTGDIWLNHEGTCDYDATESINALITSHFTKAESTNEIQAWTDEPHPDWDGYDDDEELIAAALRSRSAKNIFAGKLNFSELWTANVEAIAREFPPMKSAEDYDASRADSALAQHLAFWCGNDCERMLRLMAYVGAKAGKMGTRKILM
jgi:primase-polymerase (primpol)-like protein